MSGGTLYGRGFLCGLFTAWVGGLWSGTLATIAPSPPPLALFTSMAQLLAMAADRGNDGIDWAGA